MLTFEQIDKVTRYFEEHPEEREAFLAAQATSNGGEKILDQVIAHPVRRRYQQYLESGRGAARNVEPWHAVGDQLRAALLLLAASSPRNTANIRVMPAEAVRQCASYGFQLTMCPPYLWSDAILATVQASPLPPHVVDRSILPYPVMFWSLETAYPLGGEYQGFETNWIGVFHHPDGIQTVMDLTSSDGGQVTLFVGGVSYGRQYPEDFREGYERASVGLLLQMLAFLNSPFVQADPERVERHIRREVARDKEASKMPLPEPRVVTLRRRQHVSDRQREGEPQGRDYQHQWWVSGHYRAQWYPSTQSHKVRWIAPYLKGPEDKPVLEKVYAVTR